MTVEQAEEILHGGILWRSMLGIFCSVIKPGLDEGLQYITHHCYNIYEIYDFL